MCVCKACRWDTSQLMGFGMVQQYDVTEEKAIVEKEKKD